MYALLPQICQAKSSSAEMRKDNEFFKDLKEDIAQSVNELAESLDEGYKDEAEVFADQAEEPVMESVIPDEKPVSEKTSGEELPAGFSAGTDEFF